LNLAIGQGENAQTLVQMVRLYQQLASDGRMRTPFVVRPTASAAAENVSLDLNADQLATLRRAMIAVVEQGTARGSRLANLQIAGKTATAQNPHGLDHGWFIGFAPADKPEIVVGAIIEFSQHGTAVAPLVARTIAHYLGIDEQRASTLRVTVPNDSAPAPFQIPGCRTLFPPSRSTCCRASANSIRRSSFRSACWRCTGSRPCTPPVRPTSDVRRDDLKRQLIWLGLGFAVAVLTFRTSPRMLEWATPFVYAIAVFLLVLTLFIGTGAGTAAGSKSWLAIGGHRFGQPAELAKLAVILMLARWLATLREPPARCGPDRAWFDRRIALRAGAQAAGPGERDHLQSPFSSSCYSGRVRNRRCSCSPPRPVIGLVLAFSTVAWGLWIALLAGLLLWWRPYVWEGLAIMSLNVWVGCWRCRSGIGWRPINRTGCWRS